MVNSKLLQQRLREQGHTQDELGRLLGIKQATMSLKINNKRPLLLDEAERIAEFLCITNAEFPAFFLVRELHSATA